ncbi:MAG: acetyl-CoA carboxylase biotin carboxyl carrier protein [Eubacterium sp.]|nr:acetyl-CoA carboxylase biotin carboxyl carrier protein [Eubacterium sp.]
MDFEQVLALIQAVSDSNLTSFCYEGKDTVIKMKTDKEIKCVTAPVQVPPMPTAAMGGVPAASMQEQRTVVPLPTVPASTEYTAIEEAAEENFVKSPLVGTFYAAPSPEDAPYVKIGDTVSKGQVIGIIEAMKLMNEIESEKDGVVKSILVKNGDMVEYGQPLFIIE